MNVRELNCIIEELRWKRNFYCVMLNHITEDSYHVEYKGCEELQDRINELDEQIDNLLSREVANV